MAKKLILALVCVVMAGSASALDVPITDASFEQSSITNGSWGYVNYNSPGWWCSSDAANGAWTARNYTNSGGYPVVGHDSPTYTEFNGLYVSQALEATYSAGIDYTLTVWASTHIGSSGTITGYFLDADGSTNGWTGATILYDSGGNTVPTSTVAPNTWYKYEFKYTATGADDGAVIGIAFLGGGTTNFDDVTLDSTGGMGVGITETLDSTEVDEAGGSDSYDIVLYSAPTDDVLVTVTPGDSQIDIGAGAGVARVLTFTADPSGDWDIAQTITVTAADDAVYEGSDDPHTTVITHTSVSDDDDYDDIAIGSVSVAVYDDEMICGDWGYLEADVNRDCRVDILDLMIVANKWLYVPL